MKSKKYRHLDNDYHVVPVAIETLKSYGPRDLDFIKYIGHRIKESTVKKRATSYLMQAIGTVEDTRKMDEVYYL